MCKKGKIQFAEGKRTVFNTDCKPCKHWFNKQLYHQPYKLISYYIPYN